LGWPTLCDFVFCKGWAILRFILFHHNHSAALSSGCSFPPPRLQFPTSTSNIQPLPSNPHSPLLIRLGNFTGPCYIPRVLQNTNGAIGTRNAAAAADKTHAGDDEPRAARRGGFVWGVFLAVAGTSAPRNQQTNRR